MSDSDRVSRLRKGRKMCKFDINGECTAMACYSKEKCNARDEKGNPKYSETAKPDTNLDGQIVLENNKVA